MEEGEFEEVATKGKPEESRVELKILEAEEMTTLTLREALIEAYV